mmetsp:Transcript_37250/g.94449  ORF Transcript_37250/g.94449 Transcript_37250/m.94449 type:complete len:241 (+) Transcript_37250:1051-1773(+)
MRSAGTHGSSSRGVPARWGSEACSSSSGASIASREGRPVVSRSTRPFVTSVAVRSRVLHCASRARHAVSKPDEACPPVASFSGSNQWYSRMRAASLSSSPASSASAVLAAPLASASRASHLSRSVRSAASPPAARTCSTLSTSRCGKRLSMLHASSTSGSESRRSSDSTSMASNFEVVESASSRSCTCVWCSAMRAPSVAGSRPSKVATRGAAAGGAGVGCTRRLASMGASEAVGGTLSE